MSMILCFRAIQVLDAGKTGAGIARGTIRGNNSTEG